MRIDFIIGFVGIVLFLIYGSLSFILDDVYLSNENILKEEILNDLENQSEESILISKNEIKEDEAWLSSLTDEFSFSKEQSSSVWEYADESNFDKVLNYVGEGLFFIPKRYVEFVSQILIGIVAVLLGIAVYLFIRGSVRY